VPTKSKKFLSRQDLIDLVRDFNAESPNPISPLGMSDALRAKGYEIGDAPGYLTKQGLGAAHNPVQITPDIDIARQIPVFRNVLNVADALPTVLGGGLAMAGGTFGGPVALPAAAAGAYVGGSTGGLIQKIIYNLGGFGTPRSTVAAELLGRAVPAFNALPYETKEGLGQVGYELGGRAAAGAIKLAARPAAELVVGMRNTRWQPAKTAIDYGIAFSHKGIEKIKTLIAPMAGQVERVLRGSNYRVDATKDILLPALNDIKEKMATSKVPQEVLEDLFGKVDPRTGRIKTPGFVLRFATDPANRGQVAAKRVWQLSKPGPGVARRYLGRPAGQTFDVGKKAFWEQELDEAISNRARGLLRQAHPEIGDILDKESELLFLKRRINQHISGRGAVGLTRRAPAAAAGVFGGLAPAEDWETRRRNILLGLLAGHTVGNPAVLQWLTRAASQTPRAAAAAVDATRTEY
jgi:hypothetical protein